MVSASLLPVSRSIVGQPHVLAENLVVVPQEEFLVLHALALVGWYLMLAPEQPGKRHFDPDAPISRWSHDSSYDTAAECEHAKGEKLGEWQNKTFAERSSEERDKDE
jgi:hypothetical protein